MDYGNLLQRAWDIVWKNKFMFILGFFAALGSAGGGSRGNSNFNFSSSLDDFGLPSGAMDSFEQYWAQFGAITIALIVLGVVLAIVFWLIRLVAQAGLISSAARIDAGEKVSFGEAFSAGTESIGKMLGLNILMRGPFFLLGLITVGVFLVIIISAGMSIITSDTIGGLNGDGSGSDALGNLGIFGLCFGIVACVATPLSILVNIIYPFAQRGLILKEMGIVESVRHGFQVVRENVGDVILLIVLFLVFGFIFGIVTAIVLVPFAFLTASPIFFSLLAGEALEVTDIVLVAGGGICLGLVGAAIQSIMIAFRSTTVTLAYQEFTSKFGKAAAA